MKDLTDRALDTATALGAGYADVRVVRRRDESVAVKTGRVEGVASGESEGFGVRVLVDGAWGFASSHVLTRRGGGPRRRRGGAGSPGRAPPPSGTGRRSTIVRRPTGATRRRWSEDPFEIPLETKIGDLLAADQAAVRGQGDRLHGVHLRRAARVEDLRGHRRQPDRAGHHPRRRGRRGQRGRRGRAPAPQLPRLGRRLAGRGLRVHPRSRDLASAPSRSPTRPSRC